MKTLTFTVTNDLRYDQRMIRICTTLSEAGYAVTLVGRRLRGSPPLPETAFRQVRLRCFFHKGFLFYAEYNLRLFFFLLFRKTDLLCAIDLDTIIPCYLVSVVRSIRRVYDAHELFCEMKEVVSRPGVYRTWRRIERFFVPRYPLGYTVNDVIAAEMKKDYGVSYAVVRNVPQLRPLTVPEKQERYIIYQGAVNEGRCFETLIPAMKEVPARLIVCGDGNFMQQALQLVKQHHLENKVIFKGMVPPELLCDMTRHAWLGVNIIENRGLNNYYSLANRFFDYMHAGIPQVCTNYPAYREITDRYPLAVLLDDVHAASIAASVNLLLTNDRLYAEMQRQCILAREIFNWQSEKKRLLDFYQTIFQPVG